LLSDKAAPRKVLESHAHTRYTEIALDPSNFAYAPRPYRVVLGDPVVFGTSQRDNLLLCLKIQSKVSSADCAQICASYERK
jgi:hypothetical protein